MYHVFEAPHRNQSETAETRLRLQCAICKAKDST